MKQGEYKKKSPPMGVKNLLAGQVTEFLERLGVIRWISKAYNPTLNKRAEIGVRMVNRLVLENTTERVREAVI